MRYFTAEEMGLEMTENWLSNHFYTPYYLQSVCKHLGLKTGGSKEAMRKRLLETGMFSNPEKKSTYDKEEREYNANAKLLDEYQQNIDGSTRFLTPYDQGIRIATSDSEKGLVEYHRERLIEYQNKLANLIGELVTNNITDEEYRRLGNCRHAVTNGKEVITYNGLTLNEFDYYPCLSYVNRVSTVNYLTHQELLSYWTYC